MTANERQAEELCALAKKHGVFLFEAITTRYQSNYQFIKEQLPTIGKIKMAVCNFSQYSRKYDRFQNGENIPVFDAKQAGGALMDLNLYNIRNPHISDPVSSEYLREKEHKEYIHTNHCPVTSVEKSIRFIQHRNIEHIPYPSEHTRFHRKRYDIRRKIQ